MLQNYSIQNSVKLKEVNPEIFQDQHPSLLLSWPTILQKGAPQHHTLNLQASYLSSGGVPASDWPTLQHCAAGN